MATPVSPSADPSSGPVPQPQPASSDAEIRALAAQLTAMAKPASPPLTLSQATVVDVAPTATPPTASITISGSATQVDDVRYLTGYMPVIGDTVQVLMQNGSVLILGHVVDLGTATATSGGWNTPTLSSGYTTIGNSNGPISYRLVTDNGVFKMQWKGSVAHTGSNAPIISGANVLPSQYRPSSKVSIVVARTAADSNVVGLDFGTDGSVTLVGPTVAPSGGAATGNASTGHTHALGSSDVQLSGYLSQAGSDLGHAHGLGTSAGQSTTHTHTTASPTVSDPTWISFNNVEYFL